MDSQITQDQVFKVYNLTKLLSKNILPIYYPDINMDNFEVEETKQLDVSKRKEINIILKYVDDKKSITLDINTIFPNRLDDEYGESIMITYCIDDSDLNSPIYGNFNIEDVARQKYLD